MIFGFKDWCLSEAHADINISKGKLHKELRVPSTIKMNMTLRSYSYIVTKTQCYQLTVSLAASLPDMDLVAVTDMVCMFF